MKLQLSERETKVMRSLADSGEGDVLLGIYKRLVHQLTDTRQLKGDDVGIAVEAANRASDIIEENLIQPLSRVQQHRPDEEQLD